MRPRLTLLPLLLLTVLLGRDAGAVPPAGTILLADGDSLVAVDPVTGDRTVLSDPGTGSGPTLQRVVDAALDVDGTWLAADFDLQALVRVNTETGDRTVVANDSVGSGGAFRPNGVALLADGTILTTDSLTDSLLSVDPDTGDRTVVSSGVVGTGSAFNGPGSIAPVAPGTVAVGDLSRVLYVDLATGNRSLASGGSGPLLGTVRGLTRDADGSLLASDVSNDAIYRIDAITGDRSIVSSGAVGTGPAFSSPADVWPSPDGTALYVANLLGIEVLSVDPATGDRTVLSDAVTGSGPAFVGPRSFARVPTPRLALSFEGDTPGLPPGGVLFAGAVTAQDGGDFSPSITPPDGAQLAYLTTGPGSNGGGPDLDQTGDGNVESDRAELAFFVDRGPNDRALLGVDIAILTAELSGGRPDPLSLGVDTTAPPFLFELSVLSDNGTYTAFPIPFSGGPFTGPDGSSFDDGWSTFVTFLVPIEAGVQLVYLDVGDELDAQGDTALLVDNVRFLPEPAAPLQLAAGAGLLAALARLRRRGASGPSLR